MQKDFAEKYVEDGGSMANYQIAIAVGYSEDGARQRAYELLNPDICPHVVRYIEKLKLKWQKNINVISIHIRKSCGS